MRLTEAQLVRLHEDGVLVLPEMLSRAEVGLLIGELPGLLAERRPENFREKGSDMVRTAMGLHLRNAVFARLVRHPRLIEPALQILGEPAYVQQVKVNAKAAHTGEIWQWHYDFATHHNEDGVPRPQALNVHVFLDECNEFNGPLWFIRGSHKRGPVRTSLDKVTTSYNLWTVDDETVDRLIEDGGIISAKGPPGTGLIFGDLLVHGSPNNMSPWPRRIFSAIYNPVSNKQTKFGRPEHQHHRDFAPVVPLGPDCLEAAA